MSRQSEIRIAIYTSLAITFTLIASAFVAQSIYLHGASVGARELLKLCRAGHPSCWPTRLPQETPKDPAPEAQLIGDDWLIVVS
jgi:hypothetical protein